MMTQVIVLFSLVISTKEKVFLMRPYIEISWKKPYKMLVEHFASSINPKTKSYVFSLTNILQKRFYVKMVGLNYLEGAFAI